MKLHMFTHWNKHLECSSNIIFDDHDPEAFKVAMARACKSAELGKLKEAKRNCKLVYLGVYDDEKMKIEVTAEPIILLDFDEIIDQREVFERKVKEAAKDETN